MPMKQHFKPYSHDVHLVSSDGKPFPTTLHGVRAMGTLVEMAKRGYDSDDRIIIKFPFDAQMLRILLSLGKKKGQRKETLLALCSFTDQGVYEALVLLVRHNISQTWRNMILDAFFTRCTDESAVFFWRVARQFGYGDGEIKTFRRLLYTIVGLVQANNIHAEYTRMTREELTLIVKDERLNVLEDEANVIDLIDAWLGGDLEARLQFRDELLGYVRRKGANRDRLKTMLGHIQYTLDLRSPPRPKRDRLLYVGGNSASGQKILLGETQNAETEWLVSDLPPLPLTQAVSLVIGQTIFLIGGCYHTCPSSAVYSLDLLDDRQRGGWKERSCLNQRRFRHGACVYNGMIYAAGGCEKVIQRTTAPLRSLERYDPETNRWMVLPSMRYARCDFSMAAGHARIYVVGGRGHIRPDEPIITLDSIEVFCPEANIWMEAGVLPEPLRNTAIWSDVNGMLVAGGFNANRDLSNKVYFWNGNGFSWQNHSTIEVARASASMIRFEGQLMLVGGCLLPSGAGLPLVESYNPTTRQWSHMPPLLGPRSQGQLLIVPDSTDLILPTAESDGDNTVTSEEDHEMEPEFHA
ncbi:unnamed protein product, partial [Mesorhabditis spiculigera]